MVKYRAGSLARPVDAARASKVRADEGTQQPRRAAPGEPWVNHVPHAMADARLNPMGHRLGWMLLLLEGYCRARCYCWVGNAELAAAFGCSPSALGDLLKEMEARGYIHRVSKERGRPGRLGIVLLARLNPDLPVCGRDPGDIANVVEMMAETKAVVRDRSRGQGRLTLLPDETEAPEDLESPSHAPGKPVAMLPENRGHHAPGKPVAEERRIPKKNEPEGSDDDESCDPTPPATACEAGERRRRGPLDSSREGEGDGEVAGDPEAGPELTAAVVEKASKWLGVDAAGRVAETARTYPPAWIGQAVDLAKKKAKNPTWGFVLGTLKNWRAEGGPPPTEAQQAERRRLKRESEKAWLAARLAEADEQAAAFEAVRQAAAAATTGTPLPEELEVLRKQAAGSGWWAEHARKILDQVEGRHGAAPVDATPEPKVDPVPVPPKPAPEPAPIAAAPVAQPARVESEQERRQRVEESRRRQLEWLQSRRGRETGGDPPA